MPLLRSRGYFIFTHARYFKEVSDQFHRYTDLSPESELKWLAGFEVQETVHRESDRRRLCVSDS